VFISHDLKVARAMCHRIMVMRNGNVIEEGPCARILSVPQEGYTRTLVAAAFGIEAVSGDG